MIGPKAAASAPLRGESVAVGALVGRGDVVGDPPGRGGEPPGECCRTTLPPRDDGDDVDGAPPGDGLLCESEDGAAAGCAACPCEAVADGGALGMRPTPSEPMELRDPTGRAFAFAASTGGSS